ncbi:MAG TPA: hypothetical protein VH643_29020 [Gemmataceae bacterium]|jgi:methyl-accepting chemotaxis protein
MPPETLDHRLAEAAERIADALESPVQTPPMTALAKSIGQAFTRPIDPQYFIERTVNATDALAAIGEAVESQAEASRMIASAIQRHADELHRLAEAVEKMVPGRPTTRGSPLR